MNDDNKEHPICGEKHPSFDSGNNLGTTIRVVRKFDSPTNSNTKSTKGNDIQSKDKVNLPLSEKYSSKAKVNNVVKSPT